MHADVFGCQFLATVRAPCAHVSKQEIDMNGRENTPFTGGEVSVKSMLNGETRWRMRLDDGLTTTITRMPEWRWEDGIPWQSAHYHKGLTEQYMIIHGWAIIGRRSPLEKTPLY